MALRVGFVGAGGIANRHMTVLSNMEDVEIAAVCDVQKERAKEASDKFGGKAYSDHHDLLDREEISALYVCVPPFAHSDVETIAAGKGIHLFVEKPVAVSLEKALEVRAAVEKSGVVSCVGYHFRYMTTTRKLKELVAGQTIGMMLGWWLGGLPGVPWWRVKRKSGGQAVEQTTHIFDLARHLAGDVDRVYAAYALRALGDVPELDVPDVGTAALQFKDGTVAAVSNTCMLQGMGAVGIRVICREFMAELDGDRLRVQRPGEVEEFKNEVDAYAAEDEAFVKAAATGDASQIQSSYADAVKTLAVTLAANESAETGRAVRAAV
jgi:myo-inositol 2-dehydrogenase/D-chiro-inositol 1-dehydrogenase